MTDCPDWAYAMAIDLWCFELKVQGMTAEHVASELGISPFRLSTLRIGKVHASGNRGFYMPTDHEKDSVEKLLGKTCGALDDAANALADGVEMPKYMHGRRVTNERRVLAALADAGPLSSRELREVTSIAPRVISNTVSRLADQGLIEVIGRTHKGRTVALTTQGAFLAPEERA